MDQQTTPLALIDKALSSGIKPDDLGKLLDLQREWKAGLAREAFNVAMQRCQMEMPAVIRDAENTQTHSRYAKLETINTAIKPVYTRNGFSVSFAEGEARRPEDCRIVLTCRHIEGHTEEKFYDIDRETGMGPKGGAMAMNKPQTKGSTFSYGCRYAVCLYFNVTVAGVDTDAQGPYITPEQTLEINELMEACAAAGDPVDFPGMLKWLEIPNLADLPEREIGKVTRMLSAKLAKAQKAKVPA